jgi:hypothetical protein
VAVYDLEGQYLREMKGDWNVVHSLQLYEDEVAKTTFEISLSVQTVMTLQCTGLEF